MGIRQRTTTAPAHARRRPRPWVAVTVAGALALAPTAAPVAAAADEPPWIRTIGQPGTDPGQLYEPIGIAADRSGRWYVANQGLDRVDVFGPDGAFQRTIGAPGTGAGQLDTPYAVALVPYDRGQRVVVADTLNDRLQVFGLGGIPVMTVSSVAGATPTTLDRPAGLAVDEDDGLLAVADPGNDRVLVLDHSFGLVQEIATPPAEEVIGVALSPDGSVVYVALYDEPGIGAYRTSDGQALAPIVGAGSVPAVHITTDRIGFLYVTAPDVGQVQKWSPAGELQWTIDGTDVGAPDLVQPFGVAVDGTGHLAISDFGTHQVQEVALCPGGFSDVKASHPFWFEICWMATANVSTGYPDGTYRPLDDVTRQAMAAFLARISDEAIPPGPASPSFSDVPTDHPYYDEIEWMAANDIAEGYADGTFRPSKVVSRQAMAAFLQRAADVPLDAVPASPTFTDVPAGHPFLDDIEWMAAKGITDGYADGTFHPTAPVTRQAMSAFLARVALIS